MEPAFSCLVDEIAEPRPDMNNKVIAFTESKMFYYTISVLTSLFKLKYYCQPKLKTWVGEC